MTLIEFILWINLLIILAYCPIVCYLDIRYREVEPVYWLPMIICCGIITSLMYATNYWYPWYSLIFSLVMCGIFFAIMKLGYLEGGDLIFLCLISMFWVMSPIKGAHGLMQPVFYTYLVFTSAMTAIYVLAYNIRNGHRQSVIEMMSRYPGGFPYMIPISAAFVLSVMFG